MKTIHLGGSGMEASEIALGCMRMCRKSQENADTLVMTAVEHGLNYFDHADVYGFGASEACFGQVLKAHPGLREKIYLQSKCTLIRDSEKTLYLDTSRQHILESVDQSLKRLGTDYLDTYILHHPDTLIEPDEVAEAFTTLQAQGKVRHFGVSNFKTMDLMYLQSCLPQKLIVNQMQLSVAHTEVIDETNSIKLNDADNLQHTGSILTYMRMQGMTLQAWSPFQKGYFEGTFLGDTEHYGKLNETIRLLAEKYGVTDTAIAVAWLTRVPSGIQVILGTTKPQRLIDGCKGSEIPLTRKEWFSLYAAAGNMIP